MMQWCYSLGKIEILTYLYREHLTGNYSYITAENIKRIVKAGDVRKQIRVLFLDGYLQCNSITETWRKGYRIHPHRLRTIKKIVAYNNLIETWTNHKKKNIQP